MTDFPIHAGLPKRYGGALPAAADVVVIGGGIIGVMTAWYLAERGQSVVLCEKGRIAGEQSSRNWGWIRQQGRDFAELPIMMESLALWQQIADEMPEIGFRSSGTMYLARSHEEMFGFENWATEARGMGLDVRMQSTTQVYGRYDRAAVLWVGGLFTESDACADPWVAVPMMAEGAVRRGVTIFEDCAVRRLERAGGRVSGVVTELGTVGCDQVVVAGGAWSSLFLQAEGVRIPQLSVLASVAQTVALPEVVEGCMRDGRIGITRRRDGGYSIAPRGTHDFFLGPDAFRAVGKYLPELRRDFRSTQFRLAAPKNYPDAWPTRRTWAGDEVSPFERMRVLNPAPRSRKAPTGSPSRRLRP
ncbi:MAG: FAD-dependent oxidoreductase, partial [bacterium]